MAAAIAFIACNDKRSPGHVYMPDMNYSRAYETNMPNILQDSGIHYIPTPVPGTVRRGDMFPYLVPNDSSGYTASKNTVSPIGTVDSTMMLEAQRLYNINCAICHGVNMDAQGPLAGKVGGIANLKAGSNLALSEGTIFHVETYGKGNMGSYASQLDKKQRWLVARYVKMEQNKAGSSSAGKDSTQQTGTGGVMTQNAPPAPKESVKSGADTTAVRK